MNAPLILLNDVNTHILLCHKCFNEVPLISLAPNKDSLLIHSKCKCSLEEQTIILKDYIELLIQKPHKKLKCNWIPSHSHRKAQTYCGGCSKWLCKECLLTHNMMDDTHSLLPIDAHIGCNDHNKPYISYCQTCSKELCLKCLPNHQDHFQEDLKKYSIDSLVELNNSIQSTLNKNNELKNQLISFLKPNIKCHQKVIEDITIAYEANAEINNDLKMLFDIIATTVRLMQGNLTFALYKLVSCIEINKTTVEVNSTQIYSSFIKLKEYYTEVYIYKINKCSLLVTTLFGHHSTISCMIQLKTGQLASSSRDKTIKIWDVKSKKEVIILKDHTDAVSCVIQLRDGRLVSSSWDKTLRVWDSKLFTCTTTIIGDYRFYWVIQLKNNNLCSCTSLKNTVQIWDPISFKQVINIEAHTDFIWRVMELEDNRIVSCSSDKQIIIWSPQLEKIALLEGHTDELSAICLLNNNRIASSSEDKTIRVWDMNTNKTIAVMEGHMNFIWCLIQLQDGNLASGSFFETVKIWCLKTFECLLTLESGKTEVWSLAQLNNGNIVVGCGEMYGQSPSNPIKLWEVSY